MLAWHGTLEKLTLQKGYRFSAVSNTAEKVLYMVNAQYNPFSHMYASAPQARIVLRSNNRLQITGRAIFPYLRKRVDSEHGADGTAGGDATNMGEPTSNLLADPLSSQLAGELNVSRSTVGNTVHDSSHAQAAATTSSASSPWVRSEAPASNQVDGSQARITPGLLNQEVPAAPSVPAGSPALPPSHLGRLPFQANPSQCSRA